MRSEPGSRRCGDRLSVFQAVTDIHPDSGGPSRTVVQLADALAARGDLDVSLISQGRRGAPILAAREPGLVCRVQESASSFALAAGLPFAMALMRAAALAPPALVHNHGIWTAVNHRACRFARARGIPYIIQPMGMLEPWSLDYRATKKRIAMRLYQGRDLAAAALFMATSEAEARNVRRLGFSQPLSVIPAGIRLDPPPEMAGGQRAEGPRRLLFLSRVHPKKGLLDLVAAWSRLARSGWRLQIAGPDDAGHLAQVMALARRLGVADEIDYLGVVEGDAKAAVYGAADLFVLPTFSENFGVVVPEALAHGLPVITTRGAPWESLPRFGCGWWIEIGVEPLQAALTEAMSLSDAQRAAMGERARRYAARFDWAAIAAETLQVYRWLVDGGPVPDSVRLD
mgnify:CR=1 FL=1